MILSRVGRLFRCSHFPAMPALTCPEGCHDEVDYTPAVMKFGSVYLMEELAEMWANLGELDEFHARTDWRTGYDGLDEATHDAFLVVGADWRREQDGEKG